MIKLMMILSFLGLSLHAYGTGGHDGGPATPPTGQRTFIDGKPVAPNATESVTEDVEKALAESLLRKYEDAKRGLKCLPAAELEFDRCNNPDRTTGEQAANP